MKSTGEMYCDMAEGNPIAINAIIAMILNRFMILFLLY